MKISILTDPGIGGTFLTWTLHFLAGHDKVYYAPKDVWRTLVSNPLTKTNAHGFQPNQIKNLDRCNFILHRLEQTSPSGFHTTYMHNNDTPCIDENDTVIDLLKSTHDRFLIVSIADNHHFYHQRYQQRTLHKSLLIPNRVNESWDEQHKDFLTYFFGNDLEKWQAQNLTEVWDQREFLALNLRPYDKKVITSHLGNIDSRFYLIDARDLWTMLDQLIIEIMEWLEQKIQADRYQQWITIYRDWKILHHNRLRFFYYFNSIIKGILDAQYIDLERFDLDIVQEAVIQHELIYKHNLNFKTAGLVKFKDTIQLHQRIEPNFHPVENIYRVYPDDQ